MVLEIVITIGTIPEKQIYRGVHRLLLFLTHLRPPQIEMVHAPPPKLKYIDNHLTLIQHHSPQIEYQPA